jgi:hypothetical protein
MRRVVIKGLGIVGGVLLTAALYQNCGPGFVALQPSEIDLASSGALAVATCLFNGEAIVAGGSVTAYKAPNVMPGQSCISENRMCSGGVLSGSYTYPACLVTALGNCALGGKEISNGGTATGYSAQQVAAGHSCADAAVSATCTNGMWSANIYPTCTVAAEASCPFHEQFVPENSTITAFLASSVPYGGLCSSEPRTCRSGVLSGSFSAATCTAASAATCRFAGNTVADGATVQVFKAPTVPFGQTCAANQTSMSCKNGVFVFSDGTLANNNYYASCVPAPSTSCQVGGKTLQSGDKATGYLQSIVEEGKTCDLTTVTCNAGVLTGVAPGSNPTFYPTCNVGACQFGSSIVLDGQTVSVYSSKSVAHSQSCTSVQKTITCKNQLFVEATGAVARDYYSWCQPAPTSNCSFSNWAESGNSVSVASGQSLTGYSSNSVAEGTTCASVQQTISCNDGVISLNGEAHASALDGIFRFYSTCNVGSCTLGTATILDGATIRVYPTSHVAYGQTCSEMQVTCTNRKLLNSSGVAGNYTTSCTPMSSPDCTIYDSAGAFTPIKLQNGATATGYSRGSVFGQDSCDSYKVTLACANGLISTGNGASLSSAGIFYSTCK